ncbi:hypothetical protein DFH08DRAFT_821954 [Mycena albidolilacea]|uniref:Uncharacterized protein n=1 Tax=Mycena albidolilacea TaxID=1033008 RepID=A0AAD6ZA11_9AGAR|nr:hypothetical protein DFH08DRAFT_821954 [Mycena albidolilacea]
MTKAYLKTTSPDFIGHFENQRWGLMKVTENLSISETEIQLVKNQKKKKDVSYLLSGSIHGRTVKPVSKVNIASQSQRCARFKLNFQFDLSCAKSRAKTQCTLDLQTPHSSAAQSHTRMSCSSAMTHPLRDDLAKIKLGHTHPGQIRSLANIQMPAQQESESTLSTNLNVLRNCMACGKYMKPEYLADIYLGVECKRIAEIWGAPSNHTINSLQMISRKNSKMRGHIPASQHMNGWWH